MTREGNDICLGLIIFTSYLIGSDPKLVFLFTFMIMP